MFARAERVPGRGDDHDLVRLEAARGLGHAAGVLARVAGARVEHDLAAAPGALHQLGLAAQQHGVGVQRLGMANPRLADGVQLALAPARIAEHRDEPHQRRRRRNVNSVPITVSTTSSDFFPRSFDSPLGALAHLDRHLVHAQAGLAQAQQPFDLRRLGRVRLREHRQRLRVGRVHAARRVEERPAQDDRIARRRSAVPNRLGADGM